MNAVIALCNFCELHGPSVLFCTQAFHDIDDEVSFSRYEKSKSENTLKEKKWYGPNYSKDKSSKTEFVVPLKKDGCEGCTSMSAECRGYISNDHEARVSYASSQYPLHSDVFSLVRQACVRSLSCEVCPGREGPIYFGDEDRGHVLSYTFFLKDSQARGFQSWYSIIIVMTDKIFLLNSWPFLVNRFEAIISLLQKSALDVFNSEQLASDLKTVRLNSDTRMNLDTFRRQRGNVKARSILNLTNDEHLFLCLHSWFTWILKTGACRISERLFEGFPNEENEIDLENQEEIEDGFIKVHMKKVVAENISVNNNCNEKNETEPEASDTELKFRSVKELSTIIGEEKFHCLAYHTVTGTQIVFQSKFLSLVKSIILCLKALIPHNCFHPIYSSKIYENSDKCNFLGVLPNINIPDHVKKSILHVQVDIIPKDSITLNDITINILSKLELPVKFPDILVKMERNIMSETFPVEAIDSFLVFQKKKWTNNAKFLLAFQEKSRTAEDMTRVYNILHIHDYDDKVLKFWMKNLST